MQKRGEISLEAIVKFIPHFFLVCVLIAALVTVYYIALPKEADTPAIDDLDRVAMNIKQLSPEEIAPVFTTTHGHTFVLYQKAHPDAPKKCGGETCLCVSAPDQPETCRLLTKIGKTCSDSQCEYRPMCLKKSAQLVNITNPGDSVYVCRSCTDVLMANNKAACLRHTQIT